MAVNTERGTTFFQDPPTEPPEKASASIRFGDFGSWLKPTVRGNGG